eukprot:62659-Prymnesium_polylepis.1
MGGGIGVSCRVDWETRVHMCVCAVDCVPCAHAARSRIACDRVADASEYLSSVLSHCSRAWGARVVVLSYVHMRA